MLTIFARKQNRCMKAFITATKHGIKRDVEISDPVFNKLRRNDKRFLETLTVLEGRGLLTLRRLPNNAVTHVALTKAGMCYFEQRRYDIISMIIFSVIIPIVAAIITAYFTARFTVTIR